MGGLVCPKGPKIKNQAQAQAQGYLELVSPKAIFAELKALLKHRELELEVVPNCQNQRVVVSPRSLDKGHTDNRQPNRVEKDSCPRALLPSCLRASCLSSQKKACMISKAKLPVFPQTTNSHHCTNCTPISITPHLHLTSFLNS